MYVNVNPNDDINKVCKKFRKRCEKGGLFDEFQKREFFEKPSTKKRRKKEAKARLSKLSNYPRRPRKQELQEYITLPCTIQIISVG